MVAGRIRPCQKEWIGYRPHAAIASTCSAPLTCHFHVDPSTRRNGCPRVAIAATSARFLADCRQSGALPVPGSRLPPLDSARGGPEPVEGPAPVITCRRKTAPRHLQGPPT